MCKRVVGKDGNNEVTHQALDQKLIYSSHENPYISCERNKVFLHTIGVSESHDSLEVLFPTVSHDS